MHIDKLVDLNNFKSAPILNATQSQKLLKELNKNLLESDWITVGVMARSDKEAKVALSSITKKYSFIKFKDIDKSNAIGHVFLKGNQKTGEVYIRTEYGLGEGILLTCQYEDNSKDAKTFGPFPLSFFYPSAINDL